MKKAEYIETMNNAMQLAKDFAESERQKQLADANNLGGVASHTPGPWEVYNDFYIKPQGGIGSHAVVCQPLFPHIGDDEHKANARLIAACPEMKNLINTIYDGIHRGIGPMASASDAEIGDAINDKMSELFGSEWNK